MSESPDTIARLVDDALRAVVRLEFPAREVDEDRARELGLDAERAILGLRELLDGK